jgi:hypothetical protein
MNETYNLQRLNQLFRDLAEELDVPPSKYEEAKEHYDAVGEWLAEDDSELATYEPAIYPQGSFALGTAVRPLGDEDYDVDAVCLLQLGTDKVTQQQLKAMVGRRLLHPHSRYKEMVDPQDGGRRCWTIKYADASKFHLDVLPAIPDDCGWLIAQGVPAEWAVAAICITDRKTWNTNLDWPRSNPRGYSAWFKNQMRIQFDEAKARLARENRAEVEEIQDYEVRTPLQQMVQLLKRHRDLRYNGDEDKPISIIITTLAALAYNNEANLVEAILNVVPKMRQAIKNRDGVWWVSNPVNPQENFADKWQEEPRKAELFFEWLDAVEAEHQGLLTDRGFENIGHYLSNAYGERAARAVLAKFASRQSGAGNIAGVGPVILVPSKTSSPTAARVELPPKPSKPWRP